MLGITIGTLDSGQWSIDGNLHDLPQLSGRPVFAIGRGVWWERSCCSRAAQSGLILSRRLATSGSTAFPDSQTSQPVAVLRLASSTASLPTGQCGSGGGVCQPQVEARLRSV